MESFKGKHSKVVLLDLMENIGLGWKWLAITNTLAFYNDKLTVAVKGFLFLFGSWVHIHNSLFSS
jgi:hypothetical protein